MKNRDVAAGLELFLDFKAAGRGDILQIDAAEAAGNQGYGAHDFVHILGTHAERDGVHIAERLEQGTFALHDRHAGLRADVSQPQHGRSVGDHRHQVGASGQVVTLVHILLNLQAGLRHARRIRQGQVLPRFQRRTADDLDFPLPFIVTLERFRCIIHSGTSFPISHLYTMATV